MASPEIDKEQHYGEFLASQRWRQQLDRKVAHKALDIGDDMGDITVRQGLGWRELAVMAAAFVALVLLAVVLMREAGPGPHVPEPRLEQPVPAAGEIEGRIQFWIEDDNGPGLRLDHRRGLDVEADPSERTRAHPDRG